MIDNIEQERISEVRLQVDQKVLEQVKPKHLFYKLLHAIKSLTDYDHHDLLMPTSPMLSSTFYDLPLQDEAVQLAENDAVLLYTDGVTETQSKTESPSSNSILAANGKPVTRSSLVCIAESGGFGCFDRLNRASVCSFSPRKANQKTSSEEMFGQNRMTSLMTRDGYRGGELLDRILHSLSEFAGSKPQLDDITLLAVGKV